MGSVNVGRRLSFVAAQIGPEKGKAASLGMLLEVTELPGYGWKMLDERTWRTIRAKEIGSITAWRSFCRGNPDQAIWVQVVPFASTVDAEAAVKDTRASLLPNLRQNVKIVTERKIEDSDTSGIEDPFVFEQVTELAGGFGVTRMVSGRIERI